jgi:hypothetical protein
MKIRAIVTNPVKIWRILTGIGWPTETLNFDPPSDFSDREICQLVSGTLDGFPTINEPCCFESGPDPPHDENCIDPPHWEDSVDPPHWEDTNCRIYD